MSEEISDYTKSYQSIGSVMSLAGILGLLSSAFAGFPLKPLIISDVLLFIGIYIILGAHRFISFFLSTAHLPGILVFFHGLLFACFRWNILGGIVELIGLFLMFLGYVPRILTFLRQLPYVGKFFRFPLPTWFYQKEEQLPE